MVSKEKVAMLCDVVSDEEIKNIFWSSGVDKALCIGGYNGFFFKKVWNIVGRDVTDNNK